MQLEPPAYAARVDDWCVIPYSSGTTGQPKGCLHTHRSVNSVVAAYIRWFELPADMVSLVCLPMFHVTGMQNSMNVSIAHGATMVVMTRWDRRVAAKLIERYRVTNWRSITAMAIDLLSDTDLDPKCLSSLKSIGGGGAAMPEAVARRLEEVIGLPYIEGYGLTEVISATHINPPQAAKPQCLGIPIFDVDSRVVDPDTHAELGGNEVGEIIINAP